ncbi:MAG: hypothetical protein FJW20_25630 [Acidimicrobiia bacterium]|nr:hypothetical protein [Acidimicrobiia bacterium]
MPDQRVKVFVVWEPILATDWMRPGKRALGRLTDPRVRQFWDPDHLAARQLARDAKEPQPKEECCTRDGILWDLVAVYPPGAHWGETIPPAVFFNGPVVEMEDGMRMAIESLKK